MDDHRGSLTDARQYLPHAGIFARCCK